MLTHQILLKAELANSKSDVDKLNIDKLERVPSGLNLKIKVDKLDVDKLVHLCVDLSKLNDIVKNDVIKKAEYDELVNNVYAIDSGGSVENADYDSNINEIKGEILSITALATIAASNGVKNKIPNVSDLVKRQILMQK